MNTMTLVKEKRTRCILVIATLICGLSLTAQSQLKVTTNSVQATELNPTRVGQLSTATELALVNNSSEARVITAISAPFNMAFTFSCKLPCTLAPHTAKRMLVYWTPQYSGIQVLDVVVTSNNVNQVLSFVGFGWLYL